jgi:hypothetical protein
MRTLFEHLARYDGRLSVLTARILKVLTVRGQESRTEWAVWLRDHVRETYMCLIGVDDVAAGELRPCTLDECGGGKAGRAGQSDHIAHALVPWERPLAELRMLSEPHGVSMTWPAVLRVVVRNESRHIRCAVDSYAALEQISEVE